MSDSHDPSNDIPPQAIQGVTQMSKINEHIKVYEGEIILKGDVIEIQIEGRLTFEWHQSYGINFYGVSDEKLKGFPLNPKKLYTVVIDGFEVGEEFLTGYRLGSSDVGYITTSRIGSPKLDADTDYRGVFSSIIVIGDKSISGVRF